MADDSAFYYLTQRFRPDVMAAVKSAFSLTYLIAALLRYSTKGPIILDTFLEDGSAIAVLLLPRD